MIDKTRVIKYRGEWWVLYTLPYSGRISVSFPGWKQAMAEACEIEKNRMWT